MQDPIRDRAFINHGDDHSALIHMYAWALRTGLGGLGLKSLINPNKGNPTLDRLWPGRSYTPVSGDCLGSWICAYAYHLKHKLSVPRYELWILARSYIKNCFGLPNPHEADQVSNRSSNGGMSYTYDSWGGINQPCLGPQYFNTAGLLALASKEFGGWFTFIYYVHYWLMGGWLYSIFPFMAPHTQNIHYANHITTISVYAVATTTNNPIYRWTMWWLCKYTHPRRFLNPMWECWSADLGYSSKKDIDECIEKCLRIKHVWPQVWPGRKDWYDVDLKAPLYSPMAGTLKMLMDAK